MRSTEVRAQPPWRPDMRPVLNIQRKILIGLFVPAVCLFLLTGYSYSNLRLIEQRMEVLGRIDGVGTSIMELRRHGKLFLFYGEQREYDAALSLARETAGLLAEVKSALLFTEPRAMLDALLTQLQRYETGLAKVLAASSEGAADLLRLKSDAHMASMDLEERVMELSTAVRERISLISETLRLQLLTAALGVAALFAALGYFITAHVVRPLKIIERTTKQIGSGNFTPVPLRGARDEIRDLQEAFNTMVCELENRQGQLVRSQKLSSIGTLSAGIAHQVNNPLNNISLAAQAMRAHVQEPSSRVFAKALENIEKETDRARDIVRGLLDFARQSEFSPRNVRLKTVVGNAVRFASTQLPPGVRIDVDIPGECKLHIDPQRMSEALLNIIINGIQAIGAGPGKVSIHLGENPPEGMIRLLVEDSGSGIAPADLPHIFDPFFTRKEVGKGTGLGLSVGYGIVEECGGRIRAESEPGKGTRFILDLPLAAAEQPCDAGARP